MFPLGSTAKASGSLKLPSMLFGGTKLAQNPSAVQFDGVVNASSEPLLVPPVLVAEILKW